MSERFKVLLRNRSFGRLWAAQFLSLAAVYAINLVAVVLVEEQTRSSVQMGVTLITITLPGLLAGLLAGPIVDRFNRRDLLIAAYAVKALVAGAFFLCLRELRGAPLLLSIYLTNLSISVLNQFTSPTEMALLPGLVRKGDLIPANSILNVSAIVAQGFGIVVVGPLMAKTLGPAAVPLTAALLCVGATFNALALPSRPKPQHTQPGRENLWFQLKEGWRLIARDRLLKLAVLQLTLVSVIMLTLSTLLPGFVARIIRWDVSVSPLVIAPVGVGFLVGTVLLNRWTAALPYREWAGLGLLGIGGAISAIALTSGQPIPLLVALCVIIGMGIALVFIPTKTVMQERPPVNLRGRVISTQMVLVNAFSIGPMLFGGGVADAIGIRPTMLLVGLTALGAGTINLARPSGGTI